MVEKSINDMYILSDKNKFYNWVYPKYEHTYFEEKKHENPQYPNFILTQGQKYVKDFFVNSHERAGRIYITI